MALEAGVPGTQEPIYPLLHVGQILCLSTDSLNGPLLVSFFSITLNRSHGGESL